MRKISTDYLIGASLGQISTVTPPMLVMDGDGAPDVERETFDGDESGFLELDRKPDGLESTIKDVPELVISDG